MSKSPRNAVEGFPSFPVLSVLRGISIPLLRKGVNGYTNRRVLKSLLVRSLCRWSRKPTLIGGVEDFQQKGATKEVENI